MRRCGASCGSADPLSSCSPHSRRCSSRCPSAARADPLPLVDPGPFVRYGLFASKLLVNLGSAAAIGALVLAVFALSPAEAGSAARSTSRRPPQPSGPSRPPHPRSSSSRPPTRRPPTFDDAFGDQLGTFLTEIQLGPGLADDDARRRGRHRAVLRGAQPSRRSASSPLAAVTSGSCRSRSRATPVARRATTRRSPRSGCTSRSRGSGSAGCSTIVHAAPHCSTPRAWPSCCRATRRSR